ncbi:CHAT domain-containing protein [Hygrophoropsis aurantiaca]|uniref:CHAT domain-containing protein n=1 Tax=Hygrophoropsis aurantiaca TaxID=72124 RepID=A0ACB8A7C6_9AGAM|nr:CHAT domain-containing protein [Hygrophoropsis aurantiaca]
MGWSYRATQSSVADKDSYVSIRVEAARCAPENEPIVVIEGGATVEELIANGIKSTTFALPVRGSYIIRKDSGRLLMQVQPASNTNTIGQTHAHRSSASLNDLATTYHARFKQKGDSADLELAIKNYRIVLNMCPREHRERSTYFNNLASALQTRFEITKNPSDLTEAIKHHREALRARPKGHPQHSTSLSNLAGALWARFHLQGDPTSLKEAIIYYREVLVFRPRSHPYHARSLNNLAGALYSRFYQSSKMEDLEEAIKYYRVSLELRPEGHPDHQNSLTNLASALRSRFNQRGDMVDLEEAISLYRNALRLCPESDSEHSSCRRNLATALLSRFNQQGDASDLEQAVEHYHVALQSCSEGNRSHLTSLNSLANALGTRFNHFGDIADLDQAIEYYHSALKLCPREHPDHSPSSNNLATALRARFQQHGDIADLEYAITLYRAALSLCPREHPDHATSLTNLATALRTRCDEQGHIADLEEAIAHYRIALELRPQGHPYHSKTLNNLGAALRSSFTMRGGDADLAESITCYQSSLILSPQGHPEHSTTLIGLAIALRTGFEQDHGAADLTNSFNALHTALSIIAHDHPNSLDLHLELALNYLAKHSHPLDDNAASSIDKVFYHYELAATSRNASAWRQLQASQAWVACAEQHDHPSAPHAYRILLDNLDRHVTVAVSPSKQHELIKRISSSFAADAASCAMRHNNPVSAVEMLELGRGIIWTQMSHLRTSLDQVGEASEEGKTLALHFQQLSLQLEQLSAGFKGDEQTSYDTDTRRYRQLTTEWDHVVEKIRQLDGFSRFLRHPLYSDIQEAACEGPVIVVNASRFSCDAFIILHTGDPLHVSLDHITLDEVSKLSAHFASVLKSPAFPGEEKKRQNQLIAVLRQLWDLVVFPIVDGLFNVCGRGLVNSRIWWCPTSVFTSLPLHAAGSYRPGTPNLSDLFVSSYTPTLSALLRARRDRARDPVIPKFAIIGQSKPLWKTGKNSLHSVDTELNVLGTLIPPAISTTQLTGVAATDTAALEALREHSWVHLACHGQQDPTQPFNSAFLMSNNPLSLLDIIRAKIQPADFAFLSACHTAVCDKITPDEVIHLAAGMQFVGFKSVIGTMWAVEDEIAHHMVSEFYRQMFAKGTDSVKAAEALGMAAKIVDKKRIPLDQRIVFIHIGV